MNEFLGQLNLTVQERRTVVAILTILIIVLNYLFVWPQFGEWKRINKQLEEMRLKIRTDNNFIAKDTGPTGWHALVEKLSHLEGTASNLIDQPISDPQIQLTETIRLEAGKSKVDVQSYNAGSVKTNEFFEEHSTAITIVSQEAPLINFLYNMGNDPAMIRVGHLHLKPSDDKRNYLRGEITLTANYSRKAPAAAAPAPPPKPIVPGPKPAVANAKPAPANANPASVRKTPPSANPGPGAGKMPAAQPGAGPGRKSGPMPRPAPGAATNR